jgi:branched-chain amino acid aminotransferase
MGLPPVDRATVGEAVEAVGANHAKRLTPPDRLTEGDGFVRVTVTGGRAPLGSPRGNKRPTIIVAFRPGSIRLDPADVAVAGFTRNELGALAGVKSTSYAENVIALDRATAGGAEEAIFANTVGNLCEGTGSNVFLEVEGRLATPPLSAGCLAGVTRALLLEMLPEAVQLDVPVRALQTTSEAFLVSTGREVQPIRSVDGVTLSACPGPLTRAARAAWVEAFGPDCPADRLDP